MLQIRWHGRGGQGVVVAARLLGRAAAIYEGRYAQSFPSFGTERRGAPVAAFTRLAARPIRDRSQIYRPDGVVVLDGALLEEVDVLKGLKPGGLLLVNASFLPELAVPEGVVLYRVDVSARAQEVLGVPLVNTAMVGVLAGLTGWVGGEALEKAVADLFPPPLAAKNHRLVAEGFLLGRALRERGEEK